MVIASGSILYTTHRVCPVHWLEKYNYILKRPKWQRKKQCYFTKSNLNYCFLYMQFSISLLNLNWHWKVYYFFIKGIQHLTNKLILFSDKMKWLSISLLKHIVKTSRTTYGFLIIFAGKVFCPMNTKIKKVCIMDMESSFILCRYRVCAQRPCWGRKQ